MNQATRSNVSAWARRFGIEITNYERVCATADKVFGGPSRKGAIYVVAMKAVSTKFQLPMGSDITRYAASMVTHVVYNFCYSNELGLNAHVLSREVYAEMKDAADMDTIIAVANMNNALVDMALGAVAVRNKERTRPSISNVVLNAVRR